MQLCEPILKSDVLLLLLHLMFVCILGTAAAADTAGTARR